MKKYIADHRIQFYTVDANRIARELGLGNHANLILQSAFFKLANVMPVEEAVRYMKEAARKTYAKKGEKVVSMNLAAVDAGINSPVKIEVPEVWSQAADDHTVDEDLPDVVKKIVIPVTVSGAKICPCPRSLAHQDGILSTGNLQVR